MIEENRTKKQGWLMILLGWALIFFLVTLFYWYILRDFSNPNRLSVLSSQSGEVILDKNRDGHYLAEGELNGIIVTFLLDTGATHIAVPSSIGEQANLETLRSRQIKTAAGEATAYDTRIDYVKLGPLVFYDISGVIIPDLSVYDDNTVLLGMNALGQLDFSQKDGKLIINIPKK